MEKEKNEEKSSDKLIKELTEENETTAEESNDPSDDAKKKKSGIIKRLLKGMRFEYKVIGILLVVVLLLMSVVYFGFNNGSFDKFKKNIANLFYNEKEAVIEAVSQLEKAVKTSKLTTAKLIYNGYATNYEPESGAPMYHVYYEGTVRAGIKDVNGISIERDDKNKIIKIHVPQIEIFDPEVSGSSLDFIYLEKKYENIYEKDKALDLAKSDLKKRVSSDTALRENAEENARNIITKWIEPWKKDGRIKDYDIQIVFDAEVSENEETTT